MKELNRTDRLTIASLLVAAIFVIGFITIRKPEVEFKRSVGKSIPLITNGQDIIYPEDVALIAEAGDQAYYIIDLRSPVEFQKSHIGPATNIPIQKILDQETQNLFKKLVKDSIIVVLYGQDQLQANSAWMILKQLGFDNLRVMPGGFDYYSASSLDLYDLPAIPEYMVEEPKYDYWGVLDSLSGSQPAGNVNVKASEPVQLIKKAKKSQAEGGC
jgi:rhodanese-related sulfurtransferase